MKINRRFLVLIALIAFIASASPRYAIVYPPTFTLEDRTLSRTEDQLPYPPLDPRWL